MIIVNSVLMFLLFSVLLQPVDETSLSGYKALVRTIVYEDGSIARRVELGLNPDIKETIRFKKEFLIENGYDVYEKATDSSFYLIGSKTAGASTKNENIFSDGISSIGIRRVEDEFQYHEEFFTAFVMEEVKKSDLRNDEAAAKVLLADIQFDFVTTLPGRMISVNSGEFDQSQARWKYDVEQLFKHPSFIMEAKSSIKRDETLIWAVFMVGMLILTMGFLMLIKMKLS
ncbi:hypothetical protein F9K33_00695 [bacterium]|nr:MAG: hypothetical protein F9K33_00695 [bacterium]